MKVKKDVSIAGEVYKLDSENTKLLLKMPGGKKKNEKGEREEVSYDYLPIATIYALMDGLFLDYDITSEPAKFIGEEFKVIKNAYNYMTKKYEQKEEVVRVYEKTVSITVKEELEANKNGLEYSLRTVIGYAQGVAGTTILTSDQARNGFMQKLSARARKDALKNLGRVFRVGSVEVDDIDVTAEEVVGAEKTKEPVTVKEAVAEATKAADDSVLYEKYKKELQDHLPQAFEEDGKFGKAILSAWILTVKKRDGLKMTTGLKVLQSLYNELLPKAMDYEGN